MTNQEILKALDDIQYRLVCRSPMDPDHIGRAYRTRPDEQIKARLYRKRWCAARWALESIREWVQTMEGHV